MAASDVPPVTTLESCPQPSVITSPLALQDVPLIMPSLNYYTLVCSEKGLAPDYIAQC